MLAPIIVNDTECAVMNRRRVRDEIDRELFVGKQRASGLAVEQFTSPKYVIMKREPEWRNLKASPGVTTYNSVNTVKQPI